METLQYYFDFIFHLDKHLGELASMPLWLLYSFFFIIIFVETGFVVMPFLPGDSFLFLVGSFIGITQSVDGGVDLLTVIFILCTAAILGDAVNYHIGRYIGPRAFAFPNSRWFNQKALIAAHDFYVKHGGKTIIVARFLPFLRTFAPFVAGVGQMPYRRFFLFNVVGGISWICLFTLAGYYFGQIEWVKNNFTKVTVIIVLLSLLPIVFVWVKHKFKVKDSK